MLEERNLLAIGGQIPSLIDPASASQLLFGTGMSRYELPAAQAAEPARRLFRFAVDHVDPATASFQIQPLGTTDAALAIYDVDGNRLKFADDDTNPSQPGQEAFSIELVSRKEYILAIFSDPLGAPEDFQLDVDLGSQVVNGTVAIDPLTGIGNVDANSGEDLFNAREDVDYYPLSFLNGGKSAMVDVTPTSLNVDPLVTVFRRLDEQQPWEPIASGRAALLGDPVTLTVAAPSDRSLTDAEYLLAVAPGDFKTAGGSYQIKSTASLLGPDVILSPPDPIVTPPAVEVGVVSQTISTTLAAGDSKLVSFRAPSDGSATLTLTPISGTLDPLISVYDESGSTLIDVASRRTTTPLQFELPMSAGAGYVLRIADVDGDDSGDYEFQIDAPYIPTEVAFSGSQLDLGVLSPSLSQGPDFFRLHTAPDADVIVIQVAATDPSALDPIAPVVTLLSPELPPVTATSAAGETLFLPIDVSGISGPFDLVVSAAAGSDAVSVQLGQLTVPEQLQLDSLPGTTVDLLGDVNVDQAASGFGSLSGIAFYNHVTESGQDPNTTLAVSSPDALPLLAVFEEINGELSRIGWVLPDATGNASLQSTLSVNRLHAAVGIPLSLSGQGTVSIGIDGPVQTGVGVGMVPDPPPKFPSEGFSGEQIVADDASTEFRSQLRIRDVVLESEFQQHLWRTLLPSNMLEDPNNPLVVTLTPANQMGVMVEMIRPDGTANGEVLATLTAMGSAGSQLDFPISDFSLFQGMPLLFRVTSLTGQLDDGMYTLEMSVLTENPHPFEVIEDYWRYNPDDTISGLDDPYTVPFSQGSTPPNAIYNAGSVIDIIQNQFGDGSHTSSFTSSEPFNPDSIDIYRFRAIREGAITVRTVPIIPDDETDLPLDPSVASANTNLRLYRRMESGGVTFLGPLTVPVVNSDSSAVLPNFDWFPANRTEIDAQTIIRSRLDLDDQPLDGFTFPDDDWYYVVVKNQEGTTGPYRIEVETQPYQIVDTARVGLTTSAADTLALSDFSTSEFDEVRYAAIQVSEHHGSELTIETTPGHGTWHLDVFDAVGNRLTATDIQDDLTLFQTTASFPLDAGPQLLYLRAQERFLNTVTETTFDVSAGHVRPRGTAPPPLIRDPATLIRLDVNQFGDGKSNENLVAGQAQHYNFTAGSGPLTVVVTPDESSDANLRWGIYVNGFLVGWDQTRRDPSGDPIDSTLWTQVLLPDLTSAKFPRLPECILPESSGDLVLPCADPLNPRPSDFRSSVFRDYAYDTATRHEVVIRVQGATDNDAGAFSVQVESANDHSLRTHELMINPLDGNQSFLTGRGTVEIDFGSPSTPVVNGHQWVRMAVPSGTNGPVTLELTKPTLDLGSTPVQYRVYSTEGNMIDGGDALIPPFMINQPQKAVVTLNQDVVGGDAYYIQVSRTGDPDVELLLRAKATFGNKSDTHRPDMVEPIPTQNGFPDYSELDPSGDVFNTFDTDALQPELVFTPIWVSGGGPVTITGNFRGAVSPFLSLYRARVDISELGAGVDLVLLDYVNISDAGFYQINANLDPGLYAVLGKRLVTPVPGEIDLSIDLPDPVNDEIILDPNFGISTLPGLKFSDIALPSDTVFEGSNLVESYRRSQFQVTAPAGSVAGMIAHAQATGIGSGQIAFNEDVLAFFRTWRGEPGSYALEPLGPDPVVNPTQDPNTLQLNASTAMIGPFAKAIPGETLTIVLDRRGLANTIEVAAEIPVPVSGTPDLVVTPIGLTPNDGTTKVTVKVANVGYAPAVSSSSLYRIRDTSKLLPLQWTESQKLLPGLGPFGSVVSVLSWDPVEPEDQVQYRADVDLSDLSNEVGLVEELDETNNSQLRTLSEVNPSHPVLVSFALANPALDGTGTSDAIWGRYVADAGNTQTKYKTVASDPDGVEDLHQTLVIHPDGSGTFPGIFTNPLGPETVNEYGVDFSKLEPTSGNFPNHFTAYVLDRWGLESNRMTRTALVVEKPTWPTFILFDENIPGYEIKYERTAVDYNETTNSLFGTSGIPFIGNKKNRFLVDLDGATTASLNPNQPVSIGIDTRVLLEVLEQEVFDQTFNPQFPLTNQISAVTNIDIDSSTLQTNSFTVGVKVVDLPVLSFGSPQIPLFTFGVPGLAEISANLQVGLTADLNGGVSLALDPAAVEILGLARPTFVGLDVTPFISIIGEAEVLGFLDIASLEVTVGLEISVDVGLTAPLSPNNPVPFEQLPSQLGVEVGGGLNISAAADVLGFEVWSDSWSIPFGSAGPNVLTWEDVDPLNNPLPPGTVSSAFNTLDTEVANNEDNPFPIAPTKTGTSLLGQPQILAAPQLAIARPGGNGWYVQVGDPSDGRGQLYVSQRTNGTWSAIERLTQTEHVSNPALALTGQARSTPAVVVYQATDVVDFNQATIDDYLNSQEVRWRRYEGNAWSDDQVLTSDAVFDGNPSVAFNDIGMGAVAWTKNTSTQPLTNPQFNETMVALWDTGTQSFTTPVQLTNDSLASDTRPALHVGNDGTVTVVWLRNPDAVAVPSASGKEIWYSQHKAGTWSAPAPLPIEGLPDFSDGGRIMQVAIGSSGDDGLGNQRLDVVVAYTKPGIDNDADTVPDGPAESKLVHRAAWANSFAAPTAVQTISENTNYSDLQVLPDPAGGLMAYWQQGDGRINEIFGAHLTPPGGGGSIWSVPTQLTFSEIQETSPTLAFDVDRNGGPQMQLLYEQQQPMGVPPVSPPAPGSDGIPLFGNQVNAGRLSMLPELGFARPLTLPGVTIAPSGSETTGVATIVNRGLADTQVSIEYFRQTGNVTEPLGRETVQLGAGRTYDLSFPFPINSGEQSFGARLSAVDSGGAEMITTDDNVSLVNVVGAPDLVLVDLQLTGPSPVAGKPTQLTATIENASIDAIGDPFEVALWLGDPSAPLGSGQVLVTETVAGLPPQTTQEVVFNVTLPAEGGVSTFTAVVDNKHQITEAIEFNNADRLNVQLLPDPSAHNLRTQLLNHSGIDNVSVFASVQNLGQVEMSDVKVQLHWSRDNGNFQLIDELILPVLTPGDPPSNVSFDADGWAGDNTYRVSVVDVGADGNWTNNAATETLFIQGFADLVVDSIVPSSLNPISGEPFNLTIDLGNVGIDDAEHVRVEVFAQSSLLGRKLVGRSFIDHIAPLSSATTMIDIDTSNFYGVVAFIVEVDRLDKITEWSELNNTGRIVVEFPSLCDLDRAGNELTIGGTDADDKLRIAEDGNELHLTCGDLPTLTLMGIDSITINTQNGNDEVELLLNHVQNISVALGEGNDSLRFSHGLMRGNATANVTAGPGMDVVRAALPPNTAAGGLAMRVELNQGDDQFEFAKFSPNNPLQQAPAPQTAGLPAVHQIEVLGGDDNDELIVESSEAITDELHINMSGEVGNDILAVRWQSEATSTGSLFVDLDGGQGVDELHADVTGPLVTKVEMRGGSGNDIFTVQLFDGPQPADINQTTVVMHSDQGLDDVGYLGDGWEVESPIFVDGSQRHLLFNGSGRVETINLLPYQNPLSRSDVDFSEKTTAVDALLIINQLGRIGAGSTELPPPTSERELPVAYFDVNGSGSISAVDALNVINFLARVAIQGESEAVSSLPSLLPSMDDGDGSVSLATTPAADESDRGVSLRDDVIRILSMETDDAWTPPNELEFHLDENSSSDDVRRDAWNLALLELIDSEETLMLLDR